MSTSKEDLKRIVENLKEEDIERSFNRGDYGAYLNIQRSGCLDSNVDYTKKIGKVALRAGLMFLGLDFLGMV